jgi:hypothetical protein
MYLSIRRIGEKIKRNNWYLGVFHRPNPKDQFVFRGPVSPSLRMYGLGLGLA